MDPAEEVPSLLLYAATLVLEVPVMVMRVVTASFLAWFVLTLVGLPETGAGRLANLGLLPTVWSFLSLFYPLGSGLWYRQRMGGRAPSERERWAYENAVARLQDHSTRPLPLPRRWFVVDDFVPHAAVCGNGLLLSRGLLESTYLPAVLAHELGHLASIDGRLVAALNRLLLLPRREPVPEPRQERGEPLPEMGCLGSLFMLGFWFARWAVHFMRGGFGLRIVAPLWGRLWREHEYRADLYAAGLGEGPGLADFLAAHTLVDDYPIPFVWLTGHTHPPTELRIDRLRRVGV